jgi:hypothetical protein
MLGGFQKKTDPGPAASPAEFSPVRERDLVNHEGANVAENQWIDEAISIYVDL